MGDGISKEDENEKTSEDILIVDGPDANIDPENTVIIFDWDDTLLCSSAINSAQWTRAQLQQLELAVETALRTSMNLGETLIVTNGNSSWVQDSSRRFMPKLVPLLEQMRVVSARALYQNTWPGDPFAWKRCCFHELLAKREEERKGLEDSCMNLIVLGDSFAEIKAAYIATARLGSPSVVKTVKFKEAPSANELLGQLRAITHLLPDIVREERGSCRGLEPRPFPTYLEYLTSWASGWNLADWQTAEWQTGRPDMVAMAGGIIDSPQAVTLAGG